MPTWFRLTAGKWYVVTLSDTIDQEFDNDAASYMAALSWAVSQSIVHRNTYIVGYADDTLWFVPYVKVSHPDA